MMKKRVLSIFLSILTILLVIPGIHFSAEAADYSAELRKKGFPESYVSSLNKLSRHIQIGILRCLRLEKLFPILFHRKENPILSSLFRIIREITERVITAPAANATKTAHRLLKNIPTGFPPRKRRLNIIWTREIFWMKSIFFSLNPPCIMQARHRQVLKVS